jgi:hypothetical protein
MLKNVGPKKGVTLNEKGIMCVGDMKELRKEDIASKGLDSLHGISITNVWAWQKEAACCKDEVAPEKVDHRKEENPYESKYDKEWREKIRTTVGMSPYVCITEMIKHIYDESKKMFKGTKHEGNWLFSHDALSLMTANETIAWMKKEDYYDKWLKPMHGLNSEGDLKAYAGRPVGNSPELMPWDCSLNQDLSTAVKQHIVYTASLPEDDERKFSMSTPKRGLSAYRRVYDPDTGGCPSSRRIIQDVDKVITSLEAINDCSGVVVQALGDRKGHRQKAAGVTSKAERGGARFRDAEKDKVDKKWYHPDAIEASNLKVEEALEMHDGSRLE